MSGAEARRERAEVCDRLIEVFEGQALPDWPHLLAQSAAWDGMADGVFARLEERAEAAAAPDEELRLRRLKRRLEDVHGAVRAHAAQLEAFLDADPAEWEGLVALRRAALTKEFFQFVRDKVAAAKGREGEGGADGDGGAGGAEAERERLAAAGASLATLCDAYDQATGDRDKVLDAQQSLDYLLEAGSPDDMAGRMDTLASQGKIDPAFLMTTAKAYAGVKQTDMVEEEVKDVMYHLYRQAKESFLQDTPKDIRILKYVLNLGGLRERRDALEEAFTPGAEDGSSDGETEYLATTPESMLLTIDALLFTYERQRLQYRPELKRHTGAEEGPRGLDFVEDMRAEAG